MTLELVPAKILGGIGTQEDVAGPLQCPHSTILVDVCLSPRCS